MIKVAKFGGTSLSNDKQFVKVRDIIKNDNTIKYVVASAPGTTDGLNSKITDLLYLCYRNKKNNKIYQEIFYEISERFNKIVEKLNLAINLKLELKNIYNSLEEDCEEDYFVSRGEYLNSKILAEFIGFDFIDAKNIIFFNNDGFLNVEKTNKEISKVLKDKENIVIPGFYGSYNDGRIKTFTRGGSDITGSLISRAVNADIYENWTDVSGILMADPRIIKDPKKIDVMTYRELRELAYMGATVLHDEAVFPVREANIPIYIRNTNQPQGCGTLIVEKVEDEEKDRIITGISGKKNYTVFCINKANMASQIGIMKSALDVFYKRKIVIEHVPTGIDSFSVIVASSSVENSIDKILNELKSTCKADKIIAYTDIALVTSVGRNIRNKSSIFKRLFSALERENIDVKIIAQGLSEINVIIGVDNRNFESTIKAIYDEFVN